MKKAFTDIDLNRSVGNLLRAGVLTSIIISLVGFTKLLIEGFNFPENYADLAISKDHVWKSFWQSLINFDAIGIIQLGILILILTPLLRIIFALIGYFREKDYTYVFISTIVLIIMLISFISGYAH